MKIKITDLFDIKPAVITAKREEANTSKTQKDCEHGNKKCETPVAYQNGLWCVCWTCQDCMTTGIELMDTEEECLKFIKNTSVY
jgi:hypothetical protein